MFCNVTKLMIGAAALAVLAGSLACSGSGKKDPSPALSENAAQRSPADNAAPADNLAFLDNVSNEAGPLFFINDEPVEASELALYIRTLKADDAKFGKVALPGMVDAMINNRLFAREALKANVDKRPKTLATLHSALDPLWEDVYWSEVIKPKLRIDEAKLKAKTPQMIEKIEIQQLVVRDRGTAEALRARVIAGEDFGKIIKENSVGLTAKNEGRVAFIDAETTRYDPKIVAELFKMNKGEYSPVYEQPIGFSVIKVLGRMTVEGQKKDWWKQNREPLVHAEELAAWNAEKGRMSKRHKVSLNEKVIDDYLKAREKNESVEKMLTKVALTIDKSEHTLASLVDPSGMNIVHGTQTLELIANKRLISYAIAKEVEKRGLKKAFPEIAMKERLLKEEILARGFVDLQCEAVTPTDDDLRNYFEERRETFALQHMADISVIETKTEPRLQKIYELLAKGTPFAEVAESMSDNKQYKDGRMGLVSIERLSPEFASIKGLKAGEYTQTPIKLRPEGKNFDLLLVVKVNAIQEARPKNYAEADRDSLVKGVVARKRESKVRELITELKKNNKVRFAPGYQKFAEQFGGNPSHQRGSK